MYLYKRRQRKIGHTEEGHVSMLTTEMESDVVISQRMSLEVERDKHWILS
jgi:hypothetical protein